MFRAEVLVGHFVKAEFLVFVFVAVDRAAGKGTYKVCLGSVRRRWNWRYWRPSQGLAAVVDHIGQVDGEAVAVEGIHLVHRHALGASPVKGTFSRLLPGASW